MLKIENYPNAFKEVYEILSNMNSDEVKVIPKSFKDMIKENMNRNYQFKIDRSIEFEKQEILQETRAILAYIFLNYWGTEEQKIRIKNKFRQDIINKERLKAKIGTKELFPNNDKKNIMLDIKAQEEASLVKYKNNLFIRLKNIIETFLKRLVK